LILGGAGSLYGAIFGSIVYVIANYLLSDLNPEYWQFWLGLILVLVVLFARGGIMGTAQAWLRESRRRTRARQATDQEGSQP
jgi:branched-chain amino acid transport system permease protein